MGVSNVTIDISDLNRQRTEEISALVDTGAVFTVGPDSVLRRLGIEPSATRIFEYAGGKRPELGVAQAWVTVHDERPSHGPFSAIGSLRTPFAVMAF
jgi:hypothetical protein